MRNGFLSLSFCGYFNPSLSGDFHPTLTEITVKVTAQGLKLYNSIIQNRPIYTSIINNDDGGASLTFTSTALQITNYFFRFGKEAIILSPAETKNWMKERYNLAYSAYL